MNSKPKVAAMMSAPYSGATLFAILLDQHKDISCDGETFSQRAEQECSCGASQSECVYFRSVAAHMWLADRGRWNRDLFDHVPRYTPIGAANRLLTASLINDTVNSARELLLKTPPFRSTTQAFVAAHERFVANSLQFKKAKLYVDGCKIPRRVEILADSERFELSIIHLIRDGRGFCNSYVKNIPGTTAAAAARVWNEEICKVDALPKRFPSVAIHRVRYEDLCKDLSGTFTQLCAFLGLAPDDGRTTEERGSFHVIGNRMRKTFSGTIKEDLSWRDELSATDRHEIEAIMASGLRRFGYMP